jgi:hypothetical protein
MRSAALRGLSAGSPFAQPGSHADVYASLASKNATDYDRAVQMQDAEQVQRARDAQQQLALRGLEQASQQQQNMTGLANRRMEMSSGYLNSILGGLFR